MFVAAKWRREEKAVDVGKKGLRFALYFAPKYSVIYEAEFYFRANFSPLEAGRQGAKRYILERTFSSVQTVDSQTDFVR